MFDDIRIILLIAGGALILGILFHSWWKQRRVRSNKISMDTSSMLRQNKRSAYREPPIDEVEMEDALFKDDFDDIQGYDQDDFYQDEAYAHSENDSGAGTDKSHAVPGGEIRPGDVIAFHVMAKSSDWFQGSSLLPALIAVGMRYGEKKIFHRYEDTQGRGQAQFSLASMVEPGTFDIDRMEAFNSPGVTVFMIMPYVKDPSAVFDLMLTTVKKIAHLMRGEVRDVYRNPLTEQAIEHCRDQISEYQRRRRLARFDDQKVDFYS